MRAESAILFDLDGTLTKPCLDFDRIRAEIGIASGPILEALATMDGRSRQRAESILLRHEAEAAAHAVPQDRAAEIVATLRSRGHPVGILTRNARSTVNAVLAKFGITVDGVRAREDGAIKPSPEPVLSLCADFAVAPHRSWVVGDFHFDILSGMAAGARTVLMIGDDEEPRYSREADHVIRRLSELLAIVDSD